MDPTAGVEATRVQLVKGGVKFVKSKIQITTHSPLMTLEQEAAETRDIDINIGLDVILALPDSKVPKNAKGWHYEPSEISWPALAPHTEGAWQRWHCGQARSSTWSLALFRT